MKDKDEHDWGECEDDNRDPELIRKAKAMTIEELDAEIEKFFKTLELEDV
ncbi:hypothetical protein IU402_04065 [Aerococcaceae bacterium zg-BR9]|nr:hypothetical protein [Aerococcaceae bacterium zg-BR9]